MKLRPATNDDTSIIAAFNAAMALETEGKSLDIAILTAGVAGVFAIPSRGFYRVAEIDDAVVACLLVTYEWSDWRNGLWWWLQSVYVQPKHRGQGLFSAMYRALRVDAMATPDVCGLRLYVEDSNINAQRIYAALGMTRESYRMYYDSFNVADKLSPSG